MRNWAEEDLPGKSITHPAYEIIGLLRTKGFKAHLLPPDKESGKNSKEDENTHKYCMN